jgi:maltokinase
VTAGDDRALTPLEEWARAAVTTIPPDAIARARWSGLGGRSLQSIEIVDLFRFDDGGTLAILEALPADGGVPVRLTLPFPETEPWSGLHGLASGGGTVAGTRGGRLVGRPRTRPGPSVAAAAMATGGPSSTRPSPGDQSHTSVVIDERSILKLYRRLTVGPNPEAELLGALAESQGAPVPAWNGEVDLVLADGETTAVAIEQAFVAGAVDVFEFLADALAAWLPGGGESVATTVPAATGIATGRLHASLAAIEGPAFEPRDATPADRAVWLRTADARVGAAVRALDAVDPALAAWIERAGPAVRKALRPLGDPAVPVRLQRIHGDLHLGQVLPTPNGVLIVDFEGDPTQEPAARRALAAPLRDVAGFLRSIDHVARSGFRRAGFRPGDLSAPAGTALDAWIASARAAFLSGYADGLGHPGWTPDRALLRAFEVEKELGEFVYAATFLPGWLYAPTGGLRGLLGPIVDAEVPA